MTELYFLRHGTRIDHDSRENAHPLVPEYEDYNPSLSDLALKQMEDVAKEIIDTSPNLANMKTIHIHFSPYLRCMQSADLLITYLKKLIKLQHPDLKLRYQLLGDFALSEWIHDKMQNKPPCYDSNDAYELYTPNLKHIENKSCLSNFRPTITLGNWNGYDLSYQEYQARAKEYFKKLLATYEKKNQEMIIVISHGYMINNLLSFFINNSNFNEVPEAKLNYACKIYDEWKLFHDCLGLIELDPLLDTDLNLDSDIVYYKTNFIKKDDLAGDANPAAELTAIADAATATATSIKPSISQPDLTNPTFPFKSWTPQMANKFNIQEEFKLKVMRDDAFKKAFDLSNPPVKPVTPEISPNSEPTRNNSIIDLSKIASNDDIYKPRKLKYSNTGDIPIDQLNSKINSQLNLLQMNNSSFDSTSSFPKNSQVNLMASLRSPSNSTVNFNDHSQVNLMASLRSPTGSTVNVNKDHFQPLNSIKEPMSLSFNKQDLSDDSSSSGSKKIKLIKTIPPPLKKQNLVFNFDDSESDEDDEGDDKKYMWFGGNK